MDRQHGGGKTRSIQVLPRGRDFSSSLCSAAFRQSIAEVLPGKLEGD